MFTKSRMSWKRLFWMILVALFVFQVELYGQDFTGFDSTTLLPITDLSGDWGLKIVVLNVGQADAILIITPNGDVALIDSGRDSNHGRKIAEFLKSKALNSVGNLKTIDLLYTTHYDLDHIGGITTLVGQGIAIRAAFDQGLSKKRHQQYNSYENYVAVIGDPNDNLKQDDNEPNFVRHAIHYGESRLWDLVVR